MSKNVTPALPIRDDAVDERHLPEERRLLVGLELAADHVLALVGVHLDDAAVLEPHLEPLDDLPVERERRVERTTPSVRRQSGVVKTSSVGMFATYGMSGGGLGLAALPPRLGQQPDREVGSGPA